NGAPYTRKYIEKYLNEEDATLLYNYYSENLDELKVVIDDLPAACKVEGLEAFRVASTCYHNAYVISNAFVPLPPVLSEFDEGTQTRKKVEQALSKPKKAILKKITKELQATVRPK